MPTLHPTRTYELLKAAYDAVHQYRLVLEQISTMPSCPEDVRSIATEALDSIQHQLASDSTTGEPQSKCRG